MHPGYIIIVFLLSQGFCKEIDSTQDLQQEESANLPAEHRGHYGPPDVHHHLESINEVWPAGRPDMPQVKGLNVKCEKNHMKVYIQFDRPFYGMVFSKGHYSDPSCVHMPPNSGHLEAKFDIFLGACGMSGNHHGIQNHHGDGGGGLFIENTIIVQYDPQVQEIWDQARKLRCTWYDYYEKAVTFRPFGVDMLDAITANFLGDNIQCWMQIQVGKGPWANEVSGIVKIGQTMTMVLAIKDDEKKFDMLVRNCIAHDGHRQPIQLVDEYGCVVRPKIMSPFQKIKNFGEAASVMSYAYFQAFKFPDSMNVHFQCVIQVCRRECPEPKCPGEFEHQHYVPEPREPSVAYSDLNPAIESAQNIKSEGVKAQQIAVDIKASGLNAQESIKKNSASQVFYNRKGEISENDKENDLDRKPLYAIAGTGGMPRSLNVTRRKRQTDDMKDIQTQKVIQVVAPGDVAFALPNTQNETVVYATPSQHNTSSICMSLPGFTAGLVILLLLFIVSTLVAAFLFLRIRHLTCKEEQDCIKNGFSYGNPREIVNVMMPVTK
ncbi:uncharacterized protein LOC111623483 [Centruroides sculpturatus]|uniref:uncharacterized protein LOC111623483 n=1 Tax=Centruroides sculpturatus TaxID=218467 RepID=UPI000C6EA058|nr:uncharacterized protein LOC111623483 [Centruroides sculpturatus]